jgi:glycosyltransferase involved in cell wall biosynthesis
MALIALDVRKYNDYGIGTYIKNLVEQLALLDSPHKFLLFVSPEDEKTESFPLNWGVAPVRYGKYSVSEVLFFASKARAQGVSLFHSPHYTLPFGLKGRAVVTIHDLIHLRFPQYFSLLHRSYSYGMIWHALRATRFVITVSQFTKQDILRTFRVREDKIVSIPLGVSEQFHKRTDPSDMVDFKLKFKLDHPYILFVGNTKPHKGVDVLLRAFKEVGALFPDIDLVFAGSSLSTETSVQDMINTLGLSKRVKSLGRISNEELALAYAGGEMFVLPSRYEGFGLPALEAMACGVPVIVSDKGSLPEVVGNAALICESENHGMFADAMINLLRDASLKNEMTAKGKKHSERFLWSVTARKTLDVYEKSL